MFILAGFAYYYKNTKNWEKKQYKFELLYIS